VTDNLKSLLSTFGNRTSTEQEHAHLFNAENNNQTIWLYGNPCPVPVLSDLSVSKHTGLHFSFLTTGETSLSNTESREAQTKIFSRNREILGLLRLEIHISFLVQRTPQRFSFEPYCTQCGSKLALRNRFMSPICMAYTEAGLTH